VVGIPDDDHVVVHLLQLLLGNLERVRGGVELVGLEALIAEPDVERLFVGLTGAPPLVTRQFPGGSNLVRQNSAAPKATMKRHQIINWQWACIKSPQLLTCSELTSGIVLLSTCAEAALVVTVLRAAMDTA